MHPQLRGCFTTLSHGIPSTGTQRHGSDPLPSFATRNEPLPPVCNGVQHHAVSCHVDHSASIHESRIACRGGGKSSGTQQQQQQQTTGSVQCSTSAALQVDASQLAWGLLSRARATKALDAPETLPARPNTYRWLSVAVAMINCGSPTETPGLHQLYIRLAPVLPNDTAIQTSRR